MDIERFTLLVALSLTTLVVVLVAGIFLKFRAERAKRNGDHSVLMDNNRVVDKERGTRKARPSEG
jgi:hypothetical protein